MFVVPPLGLPGLDTTRGDRRRAGAATRCACLSSARRAVRSGFALAPGNVAAVAHICRRLDGIPLAIELAAARVRVLTLDQIAARLDDRFALLTGGSRTALPRQQTLQASIDWSYELLSDAEQTLLRRLAPFAGGWTLDAAEAVCGDGATPSSGVLDRLTRLVDSSLVFVTELDGQARYRWLETSRQYARGQAAREWGGRGGPPAPRRVLHGARAADLPTRPALTAAGRDRVGQCARGTAVVARQWGRELGAQLGAALGWFWYHQGYWHEGGAGTTRCACGSRAGRPPRPTRTTCFVKAISRNFRATW